MPSFTDLSVQKWEGYYGLGGFFMQLIQITDKDKKATLMVKAYAQCLADSILPGTCHAFPSFVQIYDEYAAVVIEETTKRDRTTIARELQALTNEEYDVENGFNPNDYGVDKPVELFNFLLEHNFTFFHDADFYDDTEIQNCPIQEVW